METENIMTQLPTPAVRNAIAFVDFFGNFARGTHFNTRSAAMHYELDRGYTWIQNNDNLDQRRRGGIKFYNVTDEGREIAAKGALAKTLAWMEAEGFRFNNRNRFGRMPKLGFINDFSHEDGRTAWISNSQSDTSSVYVNYPRDHPNYKIGSQLAFTAKAG
jgi:hypothetical protein